MTSSAQSPSQHSIQVAIEQLRYWVPTIKDVAHVYEGTEGDSWLLSIEPRLQTACPVAVEIKSTGRFDIAIGGETYEDFALGSLDEIVLLLDRIAGGHVVQRRWVSSITGTPLAVETLVVLSPNAIWRGGSPFTGGGERQDRHFLPYRRTSTGFS